MQKKSLRKSSRRPYRKRVAGGRRTSVSAGVKKYVKTQLARNLENKCMNVNGGFSFGNILESADLNAYPMLPYTGYGTIAQGAGQGQRIGNEVRVKKLMLNYVLRPTPYSALTNPFPEPVEVDLFLGYVNQVPGFLPVPGDMTYLFQNGNSTAAPFGTLRDLISTVNKDYWTIKKRWRHKIGYSSANGTGSVANTQYSNNNDFKLNVVNKLDITKLVDKKLKFLDSANTLQGKNLFFFMEAVAAGGGQFSSTTLPCNIEFWVDLQYEDA